MISPYTGRLWTAEEDEAVRTLPLEWAAKKTGTTLMADSTRRANLQMQDALTREQRKADGKRLWNELPLER